MCITYFDSGWKQIISVGSLFYLLFSFWLDDFKHRCGRKMCESFMKALPVLGKGNTFGHALIRLTWVLCVDFIKNSNGLAWLKFHWHSIGSKETKRKKRQESEIVNLCSFCCSTGLCKHLTKTTGSEWPPPSHSHPPLSSVHTHHQFLPDFSSTKHIFFYSISNHVFFCTIIWSTTTTLTWPDWLLFRLYGISLSSAFFSFTRSLLNLPFDHTHTQRRCYSIASLK